MKTVARRQGVKFAGGTCLMVCAAPFGWRPTVRPGRSTLGRGRNYAHTSQTHVLCAFARNRACHFGHVPLTATSARFPLFDSFPESPGVYGPPPSSGHPGVRRPDIRPGNGMDAVPEVLGRVSPHGRRTRAGRPQRCHRDRVPGPAAVHSAGRASGRLEEVEARRARAFLRLRPAIFIPIKQPNSSTRTRSHYCGSTGHGGPVDPLGLAPGEPSLLADFDRSPRGERRS